MWLSERFGGSAAASPSSWRPRNCRRSQRKDGSGQLVMERAQPTGYLGGHYTNPWSPIGHARDHSAQYCARNQVHSCHGRRVHARRAGLRRRADDGDPLLRRVRSPGEEGVRPAEAASLAPPRPRGHVAGAPLRTEAAALPVVRRDHRDGAVGRPDELVHARLRADRRVSRAGVLEDRRLDDDARRLGNGRRDHRSRGRKDASIVVSRMSCR